MFATLIAWLKAHIHLPKWTAAWGAAITGSLVETVGQAVSTPGFDPLSLLAWKTLILLAIKAVLIKTLLWAIGPKTPVAGATATNAASTQITPAATAMLAFVLLLLPLASCSPPAAEGATLSVMAAGDTAKVFAHWPSVNRATSYSYSLTTVATNGTWTGLPTGATTTVTNVALLPVSTNSDSAVFQLCVTATGPAGSSPIGCTASVASAANTWHRKLGTPQPVFDSVTALFLVPSRDSLVIGATHTLCPFWEMGNGAVVMRSSDATSCTGSYQATYSALQRSVTADQQMVIDSRCLTWTQTNPAVDRLGITGCDLLGLLPQRVPYPHLPVDALALRRA